MESPADMIFVNGSVITVDPEDRVCEAVAIKGNRIVYVGDSRAAKSYAGSSTRVLNLNGRTLIPGFIDAHCHAGGYGISKLRVHCGLPLVRSIEDMKREIRRKAAETPPGAWIVGIGYDHTKLAEGRHPTRSDLDDAARDHPVFVSRVCGHVGVANTLALEAIGVGRDTPDPPGGKIDKNENGEPSGILFEVAQAPVRILTKPSLVEMEIGLKSMDSDFIRYGVTSIQDASGWNPDEIRLFQKGTAEGWLRIRISFMVRSAGAGMDLGEKYLLSGLISGFGNERVRLGSYKLLMDGSVGAASAAMRSPYKVGSNNFGILYMDQEELNTRVLRAHRAGYQVAIHAIGDRAIEMSLESFEKAFQAFPGSGQRHRIEHCGWLDEALIDRIHRLEILPVLGVPFLYEHGDSYFRNLEEQRLSCVYPLRSLLKRGIRVALSSDAPVIDPNPMRGIYCAVSRKTASGRTVSPGEGVNIKQAIRAYTLFGAYASFEERLKGSIEPGKLADLVVLSENILHLPHEELLRVYPVLTMIDGIVVYEKEWQSKRETVT